MDTVVIYPGRFHPFHKGHKSVYDALVKRFGKNRVYIATSNKVDPPKSPFTFDEKRAMMQLTGVDPSRVIQVVNPYQAQEIISKFDPANTVALFAVSDKDMDEDPRFKFAPKKDGSPSYYQPAQDNMQSLDKHGYIITVPTLNFKVLGEPMRSASEFRANFARSDYAKQKAMITDLFGAYDKRIHDVMSKKIVESLIRANEILEQLIDMGADDAYIVEACARVNKLKEETSMDSNKKSLLVKLYTEGLKTVPGSKEHTKISEMINAMRNDLGMNEASAYTAQDIMSDDPPVGIDFDSENLAKVNWKQHDTAVIKKFVDSLESLDFEDGVDVSGTGYSGHYAKAARWVEQNVLANRTEGMAEAVDTKYAIIRYPDTAISYIKNDGNGWVHIYDKSYGFKGTVDKADMQYAKSIAKEKIPSRMFNEGDESTKVDTALATAAAAATISSASAIGTAIGQALKAVGKEFLDIDPRSTSIAQRIAAADKATSAVTTSNSPKLPGVKRTTSAGRSGGGRISSLTDNPIQQGQNALGQKWLEDADSEVQGPVENTVDVISINVPTFIRLMELVREEVETDVQLHLIAEVVTRLSETGVITMDNYPYILDYVSSNSNEI